MLDVRLHLALDGDFHWPSEGPVGVFRPAADIDLPGCDPARTVVLHDFYPLCQYWQSRGYDVRQTCADQLTASVVCLPRSKSEARALIAEACALTNGPVVIDGQKTDGVDSILKQMRARVTVHGPISKAHGKLFWIAETGADFFADWAQGPSLTDGGFWTAPGVFSADGVDLASAVLVDALPEKMTGHVGDLGAGWGFLSAHILTRQTVEAVHLVEASHIALECARRNVVDDRAVFHWDDARTWKAPGLLDAIVMNPPFHTGRAAEPQIGQAFVAAAAKALRARGELWMVANRHLPYEAELKKRFKQVQELGGDARFKLFHAEIPLKARR